MNEIFSRTALLIGEEGVNKLNSSSAAVIGLGGVGSFAAEGLVRAGFGRLLLVDGDVIDVTNINRQLYALQSTVGKPKAELAEARCRDINPDCGVKGVNGFITAENIDDFHLEDYDIVIDAVDDVKAKIAIIKKCAETETKILSCMGTGGKVDPTRLEFADIYETSVCPLARVMRRELRKAGVERLRVLYSREEPRVNCTPPASIGFVPSAAGMMFAAEAARAVLPQIAP